MWLKYMLWIDCVLCGETLKSHQSNFCRKRIAGLSVPGSGRRALLALTLSATGFPTARGTDLVKTHCTAYLPCVVVYRVTQFSGRFLNSFSKAFRSGELRESPKLRW